MEIASPLYDVVFKFLLEELAVARLFFSALIGVELVNLEPMPQELAVEASGSMRMLGSEKRLSIYRLDYAARALDKTGKTYLLLAEIQREKIQLQAMRFRKYLGKQYLNSHHSVLVRAPNGRYIDAGIPILPIYILGQCLPGFEKVPVMGVKSVLEDRQSARQLPGTNHFIESLFHKGLIVQTPALPAWGSTELEGLLSIFSPQNQTSNPHIMQIDEATFPQKYRSILRRLQMAAAQSGGLSFVLRGAKSQHNPSPAPLRLFLSAASPQHVRVELLKRRGPVLEKPLIVQLPQPRAWLPESYRDALSNPPHTEHKANREAAMDRFVFPAVSTARPHGSDGAGGRAYSGLHNCSVRSTRQRTICLARHFPRATEITGSLGLSVHTLCLSALATTWPISRSAARGRSQPEPVRRIVDLAPAH